MKKHRKLDRKNITKIRVSILNFLLNREEQGAVHTETINKAIKSNFLTTYPNVKWWSEQSIVIPIKVEDRVVGWELNTDLLGLLFACDIPELLDKCKKDDLGVKHE